MHSTQEDRVQQATRWKSSVGLALEDVWVVSIGRNVGCYPMSNTNWVLFRTAVLVALPGEVFFAGIGRGRFEHNEEESFTVVTEAIPDLESVVREQLAVLAGKYGQQSVAFTLGRTTFVDAVT